MFGKFLKSDKWHKYFGTISKILTPKFLKDCVVPKDIISAIKTLNIKDTDEGAYNYIIICSIFNAIFIGLPGTVGWGVAVSMAIEFVMAVQIAKMTGLMDMSTIFDFQKTKRRIYSLLAAVGLTSVTVLILIKKALDIAFNLISQIPFMIFITGTSVFITTVFYGLFLYLAFNELKALETEKLSTKSILRISNNASKYTVKISWKLLKMIFDIPKIFKQIKRNVTDAFNIHTETDKIIRGDLFHVTALSYLLQNKEAAFNGPFSKLWLEAVRLSHPTQLGENTTFQDIREHLSNYDSGQYPKVLQNIKSKFFEVAETHFENNDDDELSIELIKEQNNPGFDAISTNHETGQKVIFNYKFTDDLGYIENHLQNYPDLPVVVPADVYEKLKDNPLVVSGDIQSGNFEQEEITKINKDNFESILKSNEDLLIVGGVAVGGTTLAIRLLPFLYAYFRSRISKEQLQKAVTIFFPEVTALTLNRIAMLTLIGPVYGFFILANLGLKTSTNIFKDDVSNINSSTKKENREKNSTNEKKERKMTRRDFITLSFSQ